MNAPATILPLHERLRVRVRGRVQGVGFRPFVYGLARRHGLGGWVRNDGEGVLVEVEGAGCRAFLGDLQARPPGLARVERVEVDPLPPSGDAGFTIQDSVAGQAARTMIGPDVAVCEACLEELCDPADRRHRYPFLNCTQCGPRYTITRSLPYDRPATSMAGFVMCPACAREYADPADRRFHAQPIACPACGPRLSMPVAEIVERLLSGEIAALKGLGGYHLACDARNGAAVARLRARKGRDAKPFAVMVASLGAARACGLIDEIAAGLLTGPERPIVLVPKRTDAGLANEIAPDLTTVGLMLPPTPLHYLLFHEAAGRPLGTGWLEEAAPGLALVMTSANPGGEPLVIDDREAPERLGGITDVIVSHDRPIVIRVDDSVVQAGTGGPMVVRRSRGHVPSPIRLPQAVPPILALGGHLKTTVCVIRGDEAFLSQHIGDLDSLETRRFFEEMVAHLLGILDALPEMVAHDLHPDFFTTRLAETWACPRVAVQHHHGHIAAVLAEHGHVAPALGLALDGLGYGPDGTIWGGELLALDGAGYQRLGHLRQLPQPGGDLAAREPWRMAGAALHALGRTDEIEARFPAGGAALAGLLRSDWAMPQTSSLGRWFDAVAGLLGVMPLASYEGHAAMALEARVREPRVLAGGWTITREGILDLLPLVGRIADLPADQGADLWHGTLAEALADWAGQAAARTGLRTIALGGGCLLNQTLRKCLVAGLAARDLDVLLPVEVPPNDGGLSLGQAWIAALSMES